MQVITLLETLDTTRESAQTLSFVPDCFKQAASLLDGYLLRAFFLGNLLCHLFIRNLSPTIRSIYSVFGEHSFKGGNIPLQFDDVVSESNYHLLICHCLSNRRVPLSHTEFYQVEGAPVPRQVAHSSGRWPAHQAVARTSARRITMSHEKLCPVHRGFIAMSGRGSVGNHEHR